MSLHDTPLTLRDDPMTLHDAHIPLQLCSRVRYAHTRWVYCGIPYLSVRPSRFDLSSELDLTPRRLHRLV